MGQHRCATVTAATPSRSGSGYRGSARCFGAALGGMVFCVPVAALATEVQLGVSVGGMIAGTVPHLAVSPHGGVGWRFGESFRLGLRDMLSILPAVDPHGVGIHDQVSVSVGFAWDGGEIGVGPSLAVFSVPVCGQSLCARLNGLTAGGGVQASAYFAGFLGASARLDVEWMNGAGDVVPASIVAVLVAGPVFRLGAGSR